MAKTLITDSTEGTTIPFLRGILTRSLTDAGLSFQSAYELSSVVRQKISHKSDISTQELRRLVLEELVELNETEVIDAYESSAQPSRIKVRNRNDEIIPFSNLEHRRSLSSSGLSSDRVAFITQAIYQQLLEAQREEIHTNVIGRLTYEELKRKFGKVAAKRYLVWVDYKRSNRPLILLIGGTTGCGKSTIATEVAHRLNIIRTQSTDMLREVMRMLIPERLLPALHTSSFNAWTKMPSIKVEDGASEKMMIPGYLHQSELLSVPCEAVVQRALNEQVSLIVEGVHVHPALLNHFNPTEDAVIVPIMLAVLKQDKLKSQLKGRGVLAPTRSEQSQYISNFDYIWQLQSYLLSEADNSSMQIIENNDKEETTDRVMRSIIEVLQSDFDAKVDDIFELK